MIRAILALVEAFVWIVWTIYCAVGCVQGWAFRPSTFWFMAAMVCCAQLDLTLIRALRDQR